MRYLTAVVVSGLMKRTVLGCLSRAETGGIIKLDCNDPCASTNFFFT